MNLHNVYIESNCKPFVLQVKGITCVSLLSLSIKGTRFQLCKPSQSKRTVQVYQQNKVHSVPGIRAVVLSS